MNEKTRAPDALARLDLNLFRVFAAVHGQGSLTRAADVLHLSQPAVSNALARLRAHFGDPLFVRVAGGMRPTGRAEAIAPDIHRALALLQGTVNLPERFDPAQLQRRFRLLMGDQIEALLMPAVVARCREQAPGVRFDIARLERAALVRELAGQADLAVDAVTHTDPQLASAPLMRDHYVCVMRRAHPLAKRRLTLAQYLGCEHIHTSSRPRGAGHVDIALRRIGRQRRIAYRTQHYLDAQFLLARSDYLLTVPRAVATLFGERIKPLPFDIDALDISLYWHRGAVGDAGRDWLRKQCLAAVNAPGSAA